MKTKAQKRELIKQVSTEDLQSELTNRGYYAERLWHTDDVDPNMPHVMAMVVLEEACTNGNTIFQIKNSIASFQALFFNPKAFPKKDPKELKCFVGYDELK